MFEDITNTGRQSVVLAMEEARGLGSGFVGTEHFVLGLFREEAGMAHLILKAKGLSLESLRAEVERIAGKGENRSDGQITFSPQMKASLERAKLVAKFYGHEFVNTEHLLLGLISNYESGGARMLLNLANMTICGTIMEVTSYHLRSGGRKSGIEVHLTVDGNPLALATDLGTKVLVLATNNSLPQTTPHSPNGEERKGLLVWDRPHTETKAE